MATNAIIQTQRGENQPLITTQGFRDLLFIGRQNHPALCPRPQLPPPLIPRHWCYDPGTTSDYTGNVLTPLATTALDRVLDDIAAQGIEWVAVCFLYSYVNAAHEQAVKQRILERGLLQEWQVALSSDVLPEFREYERASAAALDAYVRPVMSRYLTTVEDRLNANGNHVSLRIMKSDGGVMSAGRARQQAVQTALSGPAAGGSSAHSISPS